MGNSHVHKLLVARRALVAFHHSAVVPIALTSVRSD
jgi:hypothetical protein